MQFTYRNLLSFVCVVIILTTSEAIPCSGDSRGDVCHITINNNSTDGGHIVLENARKTLKCMSCYMYALPAISCTNSKDVKTVDFSQSSIKKIINSNKIDSSVFENVLVFNLSHNQIDKLLLYRIDFTPTRYSNNILLSSSKKLTTFDISYNNIEIVPSSDGLDQLKSMKLHYLNLSHNKINSLESGCFRTIPLLQILNLNNNRIPSVNASILSHLQKLTHLDLSFNGISSIDEPSFIKLRNLQLLKLDNNKLKTISTILDGLVSLRELYLAENSITSLDLNTFSTTPNLHVLSLSNNSLHTFETQRLFKNSQNLSNLDISNNKLTDLHVYYPVSLQKLNATGNRITTVHLLGAPALEIVDLSFNQLTDFNASTLSHLRSLDLSHNNLTSFYIDSSLPQNKNLTELFLNGNLLSAIGLERVNVSERFPSLKRITVSANDWPCAYLQKLLELPVAKIIIFEKKLRAVDSDQIDGIECVKMVVVEYTTDATYTTSDEPKNTHTDLEMMIQRNFDTLIKQIKVVVDRSVSEKFHEQTFGYTSTFISIWLMGIVIVLLFTIDLFCKQRSRTERKIVATTAMSSF